MIVKKTREIVASNNYTNPFFQNVEFDLPVSRWRDPADTQVMHPYKLLPPLKQPLDVEAKDNEPIKADKPRQHMLRFMLAFFVVFSALVGFDAKLDAELPKLDEKLSTERIKTFEGYFSEFLADKNQKMLNEKVLALFGDQYINELSFRYRPENDHEKSFGLNLTKSFTRDSEAFNGYMMNKSIAYSLSIQKTLPGLSSNEANAHALRVFWLCFFTGEIFALIFWGSNLKAK